MTTKRLVREALLRMSGAALGLAPSRLLRLALGALQTRDGLAESAGYHVYRRVYFSPLLALDTLAQSSFLDDCGSLLMLPERSCPTGRNASGRQRA